MQLKISVPGPYLYEFTNTMRTIPSSVSIAWRKCLRQLHARRSRSTLCAQSNVGHDTNESFEPKDFCEPEKNPVLDVEPETINITDPVMKKKMKLLQAEMYLLEGTGGEVPRRLSSKQWLDLLSTDSPAMRTMYLKKVWIYEQHKLIRPEIQAIRRKRYLKELEKSQQPGPYVEKDGKKYVHYGLNFNTLFRGIYAQKMNLFYHYRLLKATIYGPEIVVDCGYDREMNSLHLHQCARDIHHMWTTNKTHANPYNIRFCNLSESGPLFPKIKLFLDIDESDFPFNHTSLSYLDLYDKNRLVYLTPYSRNNLRSYDPDSVYIIGSLPIIVGKGPLSMAKAKKEGIRTAKFPINLYVHWDIGMNKTLKASKALAIMNDLKEQRSWKTVFEQHLPPSRDVEESSQERNKINKYSIDIKSFKF